jgi:hypothetical protein
MSVVFSLKQTEVCNDAVAIKSATASLARKRFIAAPS